MWSVIAVLCGLLTALGGVATAYVPAFSQPPYRLWVAIGFVLVLIVGACAAVKDQRDNAEQIAGIRRQVTGDGGFPILSVVGFSPIPSQIIDGKGIALFQLMSGTDVPVLDSQLRISKHVPIGKGDMGSDSIFLPSRDVSVVHKGNAPREPFRLPILDLDAPNIFSGVVFNRAGTFVQYVVVLLKDGNWRSSTEVRHHVVKDDPKGTEAILMRMEPELRQLLPENWQKPREELD